MKLSGISMSAALAIMAAVASAPVAPALAAGDGASAIAERQALMELMAGNVVFIKTAITSKDAKLMAAASKSAAAIAKAGHIIPDLFPKGSDSKAGKTGALDKIWSNWDEFKTHAATLSDRATALSAALKSGDAGKALPAFAAMGKEGCGGCHGEFKAK
jgi:cytochrome c556